LYIKGMIVLYWYLSL